MVEAFIKLRDRCICDSEIELLVSKLTKEALNDKKEYNLGYENCLDKFDEYFKCVLCLHVVNAPKMCDLCENINCGVCID